MDNSSILLVFGTYNTYLYLFKKTIISTKNILLSNNSTLFFDRPVNKHVFAFGVERGYVGLNLFFSVFDLGARRAGFNPQGNIPSIQV